MNSVYYELVEADIFYPTSSLKIDCEYPRRYDQRVGNNNSNESAGCRSLTPLNCSHFIEAETNPKNCSNPSEKSGGL